MFVKENLLIRSYNYAVACFSLKNQYSGLIYKVGLNRMTELGDVALYLTQSSPSLRDYALNPEVDSAHTA